MTLSSCVLAVVVLSSCVSAPSGDAATGTLPAVLGDRIWDTTDPVATQVNPETQVVNIGVGPWITRQTQASDFDPILTWLEEQTGFDCVLNISPDYKTLQTDLASAHVDIAILSAAAYGDLLSQGQNATQYMATVIAGSGENRGAYYRGHIFARKDKGYQSLDDLRGLPFAFVDKGSSSGFQYPMALLLQNGIVPEKDFGSVFYLGSHDRVVAAVAGGSVEAGAVWDATLTEARKVRGDQFDIIASTVPIPREAWVAGSFVASATVSALQKALVAANLESSTSMGVKALSGGYLYSGFSVESPALYRSAQNTLDGLKNDGLAKPRDQRGE